MTQRSSARVRRPAPVQRRGVRHAALAALGLLLAFGTPAFAVVPADFVVAGVSADGTATADGSAREAARAQGVATAFQRLLQRLTATADWPRLPHPDAATVTNLVVDMQVADERSTGTHYVANFTFRFNPKAVRQVLQDAGINFTEASSKPVVIVPVLNDHGEPHLWDDPNPWRDAWNAGGGRYGLVPWIVPAGDLSDVAVLDAPDAAQPPPDKLQTLSQRYSDGDVTVVTATKSDNHLDITVQRYNAAGTADTMTTSVDGAPGGSDAQLYQAGVQAAAQLLENQWKTANIAGPASSVPPDVGGSQTVELSVPIATPADWARVRDRLDHVRAVQKVEIELMARNEVRLKLTAAGDIGALHDALVQRDLVLTPGSPFGTLTAQAAAVPVPAVAPAASPAE